jgi:hypothetical protein
VGLGRPVSRILLYPAIHLRGMLLPRAPPGRSCAYQPGGGASGTFWLARTGGLPGRSLAGYRRWALTPPFHPSPVSRTSPRPSAGLLSVALDVATGLRRVAPRVVGPSGLCYESGLCSTPLGLAFGTQRRVGRPEPRRDYTLGRSIARPRPTRTMRVGLTRTSTLPTPLQRPFQRGSSPTAGSNQAPGLPSGPPSRSRTPS